jgi:hypothetical protein
MARFSIPVDAVAALASTASPGPQCRELAHEHGRPVSSQQQQQREIAGSGGERERKREREQTLAALCGGPLRPSILMGLLCSIYLECPELQGVMTERETETVRERETETSKETEAHPRDAEQAEILKSFPYGDFV